MTSNTQRVLNHKGEWGCNLPPNQATVVRGELVEDQPREIGAKRQAEHPPEPPDPPDHGAEGTFRTQYRQRKGNG